LEYQGEHHYLSSLRFGSASKQQQKDQIKQQIAKDEGITLIPIPFWWDHSRESLAATIRHFRPDVELYIPANVTPIPARIPLQSYFKYRNNVAQQYDATVDPTDLYENKRHSISLV
jgi:hypothetical protein